MRTPRQYQRHLKLVYGQQAGEGIANGPSVPFTITSYAGGGPRVSFNAERTNRGISDRCFIDIYNLNEKFRSGLKADLEQQWKDRREIQEVVRDPKTRATRLKQVSDAFRVNLFVGYGASDENLTLLMRGDLINVVPESRRGGVDTITRIELGDTLLAMRDNYLRGTYGTGATIENAIRGSVALADLGINEASDRVLSIVAPNAVITKTENGFVLRGRVGDTISELVDVLGLQWWVRDGVIYFVAQGSTLQDFAIQLRQGRDLLSYTEASSYGDAKGRALLNPDIVPGRGLILQDFNGQELDEKGYRVNVTRYRGDTRGQPWWVEFEATNISNSLNIPTKEFTSRERTADDLLDELERRFQ